MGLELWGHAWPDVRPVRQATRRVQAVCCRRSGELLLCAATEVESDGTHCTESYKRLSRALLTHEGMLGAPFCEADRPNIGNTFSTQTRPLADTDPPNVL